MQKILFAVFLHDAELFRAMIVVFFYGLGYSQVAPRGSQGVVRFPEIETNDDTS